jgi:hypothetical protein
MDQILRLSLYSINMHVSDVGQLTHESTSTHHETMETQDQLLELEDGRYFAIGKFQTGLASIATTERLGKKDIVSFGLPSGPALFLHLAYKAFEQVKDRSPHPVRRPSYRNLARQSGSTV